MAYVAYVFCSLVVGLFLVFAPWWTWLWDVNYFLQPHPGLRGVLLSAYARGAVTGLGLVNILLALHDARDILAGSGEQG